MKTNRWQTVLVIVIGLSGGSMTARAEFWNPLDTVPRPNVIIGLDTSVTMGITPDCGSCHAPNRSGSNARARREDTRLFQAKEDLLATLPSIQDYFVFGGFRYEGCDYARIVERHLPDTNAPDSSYQAVNGMINRAQHCPSSENQLPGGNSASGGCLTPTTSCQGDEAALQTILANGGVPGLNITPPANLFATLTCDTPNPPNPTYDVLTNVLSRLGPGNFVWPRWDPTALDANDVQNDLCDPLNSALSQIRIDLGQCMVDPTPFWDMAFLDGSWCNANTIANNACAGSRLVGTCVCDDSPPECRSTQIVPSECGLPMISKARQQVAVCESYHPAAQRFGGTFRAQPDNIANGQCRENAVVFITDGFQVDPQQVGIQGEAQSALNLYRSADQLSNMFVFRATEVARFKDDADLLQRYLSNYATNEAFDAFDRPTMQASFAKMLSRIYKGVYTGSNMGTDRYQTRAVFHSFTVPGYSQQGPVSDNYLGFPSRISVHDLNVDGTIAPEPRFESDWASRVGATPACRRAPMGIDPGDTQLLGPNERFRNGVPRNALIDANQTDRNGDGTPDTHPPLRYGRSFGFAAGSALIVDRPSDSNPGADRDQVLAYTNFIQTPAVTERPRVIYYMDGGYVLGIYGGEYRSPPPANRRQYGYQNLAYDYNDEGNLAGAEVFRYKPSWVNNPNLSYNYDYALNDLIQQPILTGELVAREVVVNINGSYEYRTVLAGNQGKEGPGYFIVDISDPCTAPAFPPGQPADRRVVEIVLPNQAYASAKPALYPIRTAVSLDIARKTALITTGGLDGLSRIYMYDISDGSPIASRDLPQRNGHSYPTAPVCVDVEGAGAVTHCYVLRTDGRLIRVPLTADDFGEPYDMTPVDGSGAYLTTAANLRYFTEMVAFFGADGVVNLVFGSGDYRDLTRPPTVENAVFKVRDPGTRQSGTPNVAGRLDEVCAPAGNNNSTVGRFTLGTGHRMLSAPTVAGGVVSWSSYVNASSGCIAGTGYVWAMDFKTCGDAVTNDPRPQSHPVGPGIPTTPILHRQSETLLVQTSAGPTANEVAADTVQTLAGGTVPFKTVYWRVEVGSP